MRASMPSHRLRYLALTVALIVSSQHALAALSTEATTSTVFIANYSNDKEFLGWGSGFFVDEGIVVTNKHVIGAGDWYAVYATTPEGDVDFTCRKNITRSDVKINLDDDVAYMRVFLPCEHGSLLFAEDPEVGDPVWIIGYPYRGSIEESLKILITTGSVLPTSIEGWLRTDARLDVGNSGGPVVNGSAVIGVAVAKSVDENGDFISGYFIPASIALDGLLYANDARFGYTPSSLPASRSSSRSSFSSSSSSSRSSSVSRASFSRSVRSSSSFRSSSSSSSSSPKAFTDVSMVMAGYDAIVALQQQGVLIGYDDGTFRPRSGVNRAEFIKILVAGFRPDAVLNEVGCFTDVSREWFARYACAAKRLGWIDGYPDGSFGPGNPINKAEAMKIVVNAFEPAHLKDADVPRDVPIDSWFREYVAIGVGIGIVDSNFPFHPDRDLTREEAAMWIYGAEATE